MFGGNSGELLADYQGTIARLVADIDAAENHVHLLYYIFADDGTTAPVIAALDRAASAACAAACWSTRWAPTTT